MATDDQALAPGMEEDDFQAARNVGNPVFKPKTPPAVLQTFPTLRRGKLQLRTRVVQYPKSERLLDIREYVTSDQFNGFTPKGISLTKEMFELLLENAPVILQALSDQD